MRLKRFKRLKSIKDNLPDLPSKLLAIALEELRKVEKNNDYEIEMLVWHSPCFAGACQVCLAGAVIVGKLKVPRHQYANASSFHKSLNRKLEAIDFLRRGFVGDALEILGIEKPKSIEDFYDVEHYYTDRKRFFCAVTRIQKRLEKVGL